jgi:hypothetical protein
MIKTELSLEVSSTCNTKTMRVFDTSNYCEGESLDNYLLEILPVNKNKWITLPVSKHFSTVFNSSNLRYKKASEPSQLIDIPDGIYEFKMSFKPNISTASHFYHLRITTLYNKLRKEFVKLLSKECQISRTEYYQNRDRLRDIQEYLMAAKYIVEEDLDKEKGKELYEFSRKLLEQYSKECGCNTGRAWN